MARSIFLGSRRTDSGQAHGPNFFFLTDLVRRYGVKAMIALIVAALLAFSPLMLLYWFNEVRYHRVVIVEPGQRVVVKPSRHRQDQDRESPGKTALLQVTCEVPVLDGYRELLCDEDPGRMDVQGTDSTYVRRELVYLRRARIPQLPFALLGKPPVSVWVPAGDYEILVIHECPEGTLDVAGRRYSYPWVSVTTECSLKAWQTTRCRVPLPHYNWVGAAAIQMVTDRDSENSKHLTSEELAPILRACAEVTATPTPAGYLLTLGEPLVQHSSEHRGCTADMRQLEAMPREWTRDQLAALRNWLPERAQPARDRLSQLVDRLLWREFLEGWYCYAAAIITGLIFTRWGTIALVQPWRRRDSWNESVGLLIKIAIASVAAWLLFEILTDSSGCHGPVPFRIH